MYGPRPVIPVLTCVNTLAFLFEGMLVKVAFAYQRSWSRGHELCVISTLFGFLAAPTPRNRHRQIFVRPLPNMVPNVLALFFLLCSGADSFHTSAFSHINSMRSASSRESSRLGQSTFTESSAAPTDEITGVGMIKRKAKVLKEPKLWEYNL